ncbi:MAG: hypothetical protein AAFX99_26605, partial [Myxococcota bacterium]
PDRPKIAPLAVCAGSGYALDLLLNGREHQVAPNLQIGSSHGASASVMSSVVGLVIEAYVMHGGKARRRSTSPRPRWSAECALSVWVGVVG